MLLRAVPVDEVLGLPPAVFASVIAASVAVLVAVYGQVATVRREQAGRRYERRRTAVLELQEAALDLRAALRVYGLALRADLEPPEMAVPGQPDESQPTPPTGAINAGADTTMLRAAVGLLEIRIVRLDDTRSHKGLDEAVSSWRTTATEHFVSPHTVFAATEQTAWDRLNEAVAEALR